jgi:hypothetical protein
MITPKIELSEVKTKADLLRFVKFPFHLYASNPYWVAPLIHEELNQFNPKINPVYEHASSRLFLAKRDDEVVGRIAALINFFEVEKMQIKKMRFGWFDFVDYIEVSSLLLEKVHQIGFENHLEFVEGPVGFSNMDKVGILTMGFEEKGDMISWYNAPYYAKHMEVLGYQKANEWLEHYFDVDLHPDRTSQYTRMAEVIKRRYHLKVIRFSKTQEIMPYVDKIFDLFDKTYNKLVSYVPLSDKQIQFFKAKYIKLIDPEFIKYVEDEQGNPIAFAITMRSFSEALQKANGRLFPFGFYHLLRAKKKSKEVLFYLIGVHPDFQKKGVVAIIFDEFAQSYIKHGIKRAFRTPELETNSDIHSLWKEFNPINHKRRKTFRKNIEANP